MANTYDIGDLVRITATFTDAAGDATDPDVVRMKYQDPSGTEATDSNPTNSATGVYYADIDVDEAGTWYYRFEGETSGGSPQGAYEAFFYARASEF